MMTNPRIVITTVTIASFALVREGPSCASCLIEQPAASSQLTS
jgi:hypothetical protein